MLVYVADKVQFLHDCESREIHSRHTRNCAATGGKKDMNGAVFMGGDITGGWGGHFLFATQSGRSVQKRERRKAVVRRPCPTERWCISACAGGVARPS